MPLRLAEMPHAAASAVVSRDAAHGAAPRRLLRRLAVRRPAPSVAPPSRFADPLPAPTADSPRAHGRGGQRLGGAARARGRHGGRSRQEDSGRSEREEDGGRSEGGGERREESVARILKHQWRVGDNVSGIIGLWSCPSHPGPHFPASKASHRPPAARTHRPQPPPPPVSAPLPSPSTPAPSDPPPSPQPTHSLRARLLAGKGSFSFSPPNLASVSPLPFRLRNLGNYVSLRGIKGLTFNCLGSMSKWEPVTFEESLSFVKKVKAREYMLYLSLLDVLNRNDQIPLEAYSELSLLFRHYEDLLEELSKFRPLPCPNNADTHGSIWIIIFVMPFLLLSLVLAFEKPLKYFMLQQPVAS